MDQKNKELNEEYSVLCPANNFSQQDLEAWAEVVAKLSTGYPGDLEDQNRIYSGILGKYINPKTGEVIDE